MHLPFACALAVGSAFLLPTLQAQSFAFGEFDLLLAFRRTGSPNLEVNIGPSSSYLNASQPITLSGYTPAQLTAAYGNLNNLSWTVIGAARPGVSSADFPQNTLFVTRARADVNTPSDPFARKSNSTQSQVSSTIAGIAGINAVAGAKPWSAGTPLDPILNNSTSVIIPEANASSYTSLAGTSGTLNNKFGAGFGGSGVENTTPASFNSGFSASDLYEIIPGSGDATRLGTFSFFADGSATFTPVPEPTIYATIFGGGLALFAVLRARRRQQSAPELSNPSNQG